MTNLIIWPGFSAN